MRRIAIAVALLIGVRVAGGQPGAGPGAGSADAASADVGSAATGSDATPTATPKQLAAAHYIEGQKKFSAAAYLDAANEFEAAYALDADPVYLYNTAQAYRLGSACARAADFYRRFLAVVPNPPNLDKVQHYLAELDACAKAEMVDEPATKAPPHVEPSNEALLAPATAPVDRPIGERKLALPLALAGAGIVALAVGGIFTHDVSTLEGYSQSLCASATICDWSASKQARAADLQSRGRRDSALAITSYGVGGAAIVAAALVYVFSARAPVTVVAAPHGVGVMRGFEF